MNVELKPGQEIHDGKLYGWTGRTCPHCKGDKEIWLPEFDWVHCHYCGGTGDEYGVMPVQPEWRILDVP